MRNELILWLVVGGWAAVLLLAMMRRRQQVLDRLLHTYVQRETQAAARRQRAGVATGNAAVKGALEAASKPE